MLATASAAQAAVAFVNFGLPAIGPQLSLQYSLSLAALGAVLTAGLLGSVPWTRARSGGSTVSLTSAPLTSAEHTSEAESFQSELQVRAAEASTQMQAAELLGEELQASIASSDLADLRSLASRNDIELDEPVLEPEQND